MSADPAATGAARCRGRPDPRGDDPARRSLRGRRPAAGRRPRGPGRPIPRPGWTSPTSRRTPTRSTCCTCTAATRTSQRSPCSAGRRRRAGSACRSWSPSTGCRRAPGAPRTPAEAAYHAHLEAVLATAEVVLTLTPGAADEIADRFGRTAIVVAHPSAAVPDPALGCRARARRTAPRAAGAGVPDAWALVRAALSGAVSGGGRLRVLTDDERHVGRAVRELADRGDLELVVHTADRAARRSCSSCTSPSCPSRRGTHSPDLEVCRDVGTLVVAPDLRLVGRAVGGGGVLRHRRERLARPALAHRGGRRGPDPADAAAGRPRAGAPSSGPPSRRCTPAVYRAGGRTAAWPDGPTQAPARRRGRGRTGRMRVWAGAGSNRRPLAFQASARTD